MRRPRCWQLIEIGEERLELRVCEGMTAQELAMALLWSKAAVRRVLSRGQLARDGVVLAPTVMLAPGDMVTLSFWCEQDPVRVDDTAVTVCYQDRLLLAVDKPAGLLVHADGTEADTLTARVQGLLARQRSGAKAQAVQRLDVETTGLVLFSLTEEFQPALDAQVAGHDMRKRYLAVVAGELEGTRDGWRELSWPIGRDRHDARRMRASASGKPALTRVCTLSCAHGRSLLLVELKTGRRHQIRVHLARAGHPIMGDVLYGGARCAEGLMLHAWEERVVHPVTTETLDLRTEVPQRISRLFPAAALREW